jgi:hypothetical protein
MFDLLEKPWNSLSPKEFIKFFLQINISRYWNPAHLNTAVSSRHTRD